MASVRERGSLRLWNPASGELLSSVKGHADRTFGVAFSPDDSVFATSGSDASVRLWDTATGKLLLELTNSDRSGGNTRPVAFSPDGRLLASSTSQGTIQIWNLHEGGEPITIVQAHERDIASLMFNADGTQLISTGTRRVRTGARSSRAVSTIVAWNVANGAQAAVYDAGEALDGYSALAATRDRTTLVSAHRDRYIVWDLASRQPKRTISVPPGNTIRRTQSIALSPNGRLLAAASGHLGDNKVHLWDISTGESLLPQENSHREGVLSVAFSPDGKWIATASADNTTRLWNAATGEHVRKIDEGTGWARYIEFFPDGQRVAIGRETRVVGGTPGFQGEMKICRVSDGQVLQHFLTPDRVMCGTISPDGGRVAAGIGLRSFAMGQPAEGQIKIIVWDADLGGVVAEGTGPTSQFQQVVFANGAEELWSTSEDATLRKWNSQTGREIEHVVLQDRLTFARALVSPIAARAVTGNLESMPGGRSRGLLRVRSLAEPAAVWEKSFADGWPSVVEFSRDEKVIAAHLRAISGSQASEKIVLCSAESGDELLSLNGGDYPVRSLAFSSDGKRLAAGMELGDTLVWDISATQR
jgi:WD40 repeat protein